MAKLWSAEVWVTISGKNLYKGILVLVVYFSGTFSLLSPPRLSLSLRALSLPFGLTLPGRNSAARPPLASWPVMFEPSPPPLRNPTGLRVYCGRNRLESGPKGSDGGKNSTALGFQFFGQIVRWSPMDLEAHLTTSSAPPALSKLWKLFTLHHLWWHVAARPASVWEVLWPINLHLSLWSC